MIPKCAIIAIQFMKHPVYFFTGVDTGVGKTLGASIFAKAVQGAYWKPIHSGGQNRADEGEIAAMFPDLKILPSRYVFPEAVSTYAAARNAGIQMNIDHFNLPNYDGPIVIEGSGGLLSPINARDRMIDLALRFDARIVLVTRHYPGSINHTLLNLEYLRLRQIPLDWLIVNGDPLGSTEEFLLSHPIVKHWFRIPTFNQLNALRLNQVVELLRKKIELSE